MSEKCTIYLRISKTEIRFLSFISENHTSHNNSDKFLNKKYICQSLCMTDMCNCQIKCVKYNENLTLFTSIPRRFS